MHYSFTPQGVCSYNIEFDIDNEARVTNIKFEGGCNGNLKAIGKLCEGKSADYIADTLKGNTCGMKGTSCADQLAKAMLEAKSKL